MKFKRGEIALLAFNALYVTAFTWYYVRIRNFEFFGYVAVLVFFFGLIGVTLRRSKFNYPILVGLSLWGFLHLAGGGLRLGGKVLYAWTVVPIVAAGELTVLKFDQVVHAFGFGVTTFVAYHLLRPYLNERANYKIIYPLLVATSMGLGALNEMVEFTAVVLLPKTNVGGYYNTALDLVFNTLGAITAVVIIHFRRRRERNLARV